MVLISNSDNSVGNAPLVPFFPAVKRLRLDFPPSNHASLGFIRRAASMGFNMKLARQMPKCCFEALWRDGKESWKHPNKSQPSLTLDK